MKISGLICGTFLERPNRFTIIFEHDGKHESAHLRDPGRLKELLIPGVKVLLKPVDYSSHRKTKFDVIAADHKGMLVLINSGLHSELATELIENHLIDELICFKIDKKEYSYGRSRIDFLLSGNSKKMLLEVKGCTLVHEGHALFPDAPTFRGRKHLMELIKARKEGYHAAVLFLVLREDAIVFSANIGTDPEFSSTLRLAYEAGVQIFSYSYEILLNEDRLRIIPKKRIEIEI